MVNGISCNPAYIDLLKQREQMLNAGDVNGMQKAVYKRKGVILRASFTNKD